MCKVLREETICQPRGALSQEPGEDKCWREDTWPAFLHVAGVPYRTWFPDLLGSLCICLRGKTAESSELGSVVYGLKISLSYIFLYR